MRLTKTKHNLQFTAAWCREPELLFKVGFGGGGRREKSLFIVTYTPFLFIMENLYIHKWGLFICRLQHSLAVRGCISFTSSAFVFISKALHPNCSSSWWRSFILFGRSCIPLIQSAERYRREREREGGQNGMAGTHTRIICSFSIIIKKGGQANYWLN